MVEPPHIGNFPSSWETEDRLRIQEIYQTVLGILDSIK